MDYRSTLHLSLFTFYELQQTHRIHRDHSVSRYPVQMGSGDPPALTDGTDPLSGRYRVSLRYISPAQMEVRGHKPSPVIDVDRTTSQVEVSHQSHDTATRGRDRSANGAREVGTRVPALHLTVVHPRSPEDTGCPRGPGQLERSAPEAWPFTRGEGYLPASRVLPLDTRAGRSVRLGEAGGDGDCLPRIASRSDSYSGMHGVYPVFTGHEEHHGHRVGCVEGDTNHPSVLCVRDTVEVDRLSRGNPAPELRIRYPDEEPPHSALDKRLRFRPNRDRLGKRVLCGERMDDGEDACQHPNARKSANQRSPLTSRVGDGAVPSGARHGSFREILAQ